MKNILLVEPFFTGSHRQWAEGFRAASQHQVQILSLPGRHWKWRMFGGAVTLAQEAQNLQPDLILASDMLDLTTFKALLPYQVPSILYFHENQITYPWSPTDQQVERNEQYGFINFTSALVADQLWFNSDFHRTSFLDALPAFLGKYPDYQSLERIPEIQAKAHTQYLGLSLHELQQPALPDRQGPPVLLWNHRWEYDKDPESFFELCLELQEQKVDFRMIVLGESFRNSPDIFSEARALLSSRIQHWGYATSRAAYAELLAQSDILPVTSKQDFFGGSTVEAICAGVWPLLPDRLAFPEHLPPEHQERHLYRSSKELLEKTLFAIENLTKIRQEKSLRQFVKRYDWAAIGPQYDKAIDLVTMG